MSKWVNEWQCHLLSCPGQLKSWCRMLRYLFLSFSFYKKNKHFWPDNTSFGPFKSIINSFGSVFNPIRCKKTFLALKCEIFMGSKWQTFRKEEWGVRTIPPLFFNKKKQGAVRTPPTISLTFLFDDSPWEVQQSKRGLPEYWYFSSQHWSGPLSERKIGFQYYFHKQKKKKSSGEGCLKKGLNGVCLKEDLPSKIFLMWYGLWHLYFATRVYRTCDVFPEENCREKK